jgi:branched-chain amino acid transport system ATP-binding protein
LENSILQLENVDAFYGESQALYGVGFSLSQGSILGLLGRNGAGKTTCLSTIMGFVKAKGGEIRLDGQKVSALAPEDIVRSGVAIVPQGRRVFRSLTVRENLRVAVHPTKQSAQTMWSIDRVFDTFPRLRERRNQYAGLLSGGEQQMLAIGRALVANPRVLLMDEPSEGLAPQIVQEVEAIIASLRKEGLSIILVEQNAELAMRLAQHIVMFNTGSVVFSGKVEEALLQPELIDKYLAVF